MFVATDETLNDIPKLVCSAVNAAFRPVVPCWNDGLGTGGTVSVAHSMPRKCGLRYQNLGVQLERTFAIRDKRNSLAIRAPRGKRIAKGVARDVRRL